MVRGIERRDFVRGIGLTGIVGMAGCIGGPGTDSDGGDGGDGGDGSQPTETPSGDGGDGQEETETPTEEPTEAPSQTPDVINVIGYPASGIQMFRDYYSMRSGDDEQLLVPDGMLAPDMQQQVGNPMENLTGTAPSAAGPNREAFTQLFKDEYGESPGVFTSHTFDAVAILILANAAAGENSGPAVRDQMRNVANGDGMAVGPSNLVEGVNAAAAGEAVNYAGASSATDFDSRGDPAAAAYDVWKFNPDGGDPKILETIDFQGNAGGASADSIPGGTGRTVKVGLLLPSTGDLASVGQPMVKAGKLAANVANDGDADVTVDLQVEDTQTSPQAGVTSANALINAGYPCVAGPASSGVNVPVSQQVFIPNQVVGCSPSSTALSVSFLEDDDFVFRTAPSDLLQGQVMAQVAAERLGGSTTSTLYVNNDYGQQLSEQYSTTFEEDHGGSVWKQVAFLKEQSSYQSVLSDALSK